jgi:NAD(P)-dependent dehydrogenase (short-subunit alcohol dehydrogenase family)
MRDSIWPLKTNYKQMNLVLTGSTSGIGWEKVKGLYPTVTNLILPVRNLEKAKSLLSKFPDQKKIHLIEMDLADMKSVEKAAKQIASEFPKIDVLINNAGGMFPAGARTKDGLDQSFAVNHLGPFILTKILLPNLLAAKGKVIYVSSEAHRIAKVNKADLGLLRSPNTINAYSNVKLYNILMSRYLVNNYKNQGLTSYSLHPGAVRTAFGSDSGTIGKALIRATQLFFISPKKGAETSIFLANEPSEKLINGAYYVRKKAKSPTSLATDTELGKNLWNFSEEILIKILS